MEKMVDRNMFNNCYQHKRVFITGHTGFKGAWLFFWLTQLGAQVKGYALPPEYEGGIFDHLSQDTILSEFGDIRNVDKLSESISAFQPDFIFHLAAQPLVRLSYDQPVATFETNVIGTVNVLEAMRKLAGKCTAVVVTTDKVYKNLEDGTLYKESDKLGGHDPYSASKACTELVTDSYRNSFFSAAPNDTNRKSVATARAGNVIGGGDWSKDRLIPDIIRSLEARKTIDIRNPDAVRPWQHVLEPLSGYLLLGQLLHESPHKYGDAYNFGPNTSHHRSVAEMASLMIKQWGSGEWTSTPDTSNKHEANLLHLDVSKSRDELGWVPKLSDEEAISWTVEWYKANKTQKLEVCRKQINQYSER